MLPLQLFVGNSLGTVLLTLVVAFAIVLFGTYFGVLGALRTFFRESSGQNAPAVEEE